METKDQNLTDRVCIGTNETFSSNELNLDHDWFNMLLQINLSRDNFDLEYEMGYNNDSNN